jgi:hypothetical protein
MTDSVMTIASQLVLPDKVDGKNPQAFKLSVSIPANDDTGVMIDNVMKGDRIYIYDASGICSFKSAKMKRIKSIVRIANVVAEGILLAATEGAAAPAIPLWNTALKEIGNAVGDSDIKHSRRDAYGQDPGTEDYGKNEGGLIVCMPESKGAVYATDKFHFHDGAKQEGRLYKYYSQAAKDSNVLFPCNHKNEKKDGGRLSATASVHGAIHVLAFDSNFDDNAGAYNVSLVVIREGYDPNTCLAALGY